MSLLSQLCSFAFGCNVFTLGIICTLCLLLLDYTKRKKPCENFPPGPPSWPFVGNLPQMNFRNPHNCFIQVSVTNAFPIWISLLQSIFLLFTWYRLEIIAIKLWSVRSKAPALKCSKCRWPYLITVTNKKTATQNLHMIISHGNVAFWPLSSAIILKGLFTSKQLIDFR